MKKRIREFGLLPLLLVLTSCETVKVPRERELTVTVKPQFEEERIGGGDYHTLAYLSEDGVERSVTWPLNAPAPKTVAKDQLITLDLVEEEWTMSLGKKVSTSWSPELVRVSQGNRTLYDGSICRVHQIPMERKVMPISYGLPAIGTPYWEAHGNEFPNNGSVLGGCSVDHDRPVTHTWVCSKCVARQEEWEISNDETEDD